MPFHNTLSPLLSLHKTNPADNLSAVHKIKQFRTAQLHIQRNPVNLIFAGEERTHAISREGMLHFLSGIKVAASLTVEAALVLPLFAVSICFLMMPMIIMDAQAKLQARMEQAADLVSGAECIRVMFSSSGQNAESDGKIEEYLKRSPQLMASFASVTAEFPADRLGDPIPTSWKMPDPEDPMITFRITSEPRFPLASFLDVNWGYIGLITSKRAWVGREGGAGRNYLTEEKEPEEQPDQIVYVARNAVNSSRYHVSSSCHYISNKMTAVSGSELSSMRSKDGGKYKPCSSCKPSASGTVYLFPSSAVYHAGTNCKAIQSFAVEMKKSEAEKRGYSPCSYCGKKH